MLTLPVVGLISRLFGNGMIEFAGSNSNVGTAPSFMPAVTSGQAASTSGRHANHGKRMQTPGRRELNIRVLLMAGCRDRASDLGPRASVGPGGIVRQRSLWLRPKA